MMPKSGNAPPGYFEYVVPPLEEFCVQCMHQGSFDEEPATLEKMKTVLRYPVRRI